MTNSEIAKVDPTWAWSEFVPDSQQPWTRQLAAHLYRRAGCGANWNALDAAVARGVRESVTELVRTNPPDVAQFEVSSTQLAQSVLATNDSKNLSAWWLHRILNSPFPLVEKMTLFWHGHFASSAEKVTNPALMYEQNQLLRRLALGNFNELSHEISRDPAMLIYLDSVTNRKTHPNENYARELMELFCLGEGNYSEQDVQQLARCFTGWEIKGQSFRFNRFQHDTGVKTILEKVGPFSGDEGIDIVVTHDAMPRFIVRKLIRYFIFDEPEAPDQLVEPLARLYRESDLQTSIVVERILRSRLFYSSFSVGRKIRSPVELLVGFLTCFAGTTNLYNLARDLSELGHALFYPPNVKGWDGGRAWINSSTLLGRANAIYRLLHDENTKFGSTMIGEYVEQTFGDSKDVSIDRLLELVMAIPIDPETKVQLKRELAADASAGTDHWTRLLHIMATLPEFQFG